MTTFGDELHKRERFDKLNRRARILAVVKASVVDLLAYDRKNDEDLPLGQIEEALEAGEITVSEISVAFEMTLREEL